MRIQRTLSIAFLVAVFVGPAQAKNDIRGIATARPLADVLEDLEWDGAKCLPQTRSSDPIVCDYDARTKMTLYFSTAAPNWVEKIVYTFAFGKLDKMRAKLRELYGLRRDRIEGEHRLFTGERLIVELSQSGTGVLTIVNDDQTRKDRAPKAK